MAKRAGAFRSEKRRKEIDRLKKQEEKRQRRQVAKDAPGQTQEAGSAVAAPAPVEAKSEIKKATKGNAVKVHYTGKLDDGTVFDSSRPRGETLDFTVGSSQLIRGFSDAVTGMAVGETKTVVLPCEDAYGELKPDLVMRVPRKDFPAAIEPVIGMPLNVRHPSGGVIDVVITEIGDDVVVLDANHPLAGKTLTFEIELISIA